VYHGPSRLRLPRPVPPPLTTGRPCIRLPPAVPAPGRC